MFEYRNGSILTPFNYVYGLRVGHRHRAAPYRPGVEGRAGRRSRRRHAGVRDESDPTVSAGQPVMELCERAAEHRRAHHRPVHAVLGAVVLSDRPFHPAARPVARASHRRHTRLATILLAWILIDAVVTPPAIFLYGSAPTAWCPTTGSRSISGGFSMATSCARISRTCACESHRGSSGTIYRPQARSAVMAYGRHARLAPS